MNLSILTALCAAVGWHPGSARQVPHAPRREYPTGSVCYGKKPRSQKRKHPMRGQCYAAAFNIPTHV